jgi:hypothetical protein
MYVLNSWAIPKVLLNNAVVFYAYFWVLAFKGLSGVICMITSEVKCYAAN